MGGGLGTLAVLGILLLLGADPKEVLNLALQSNAGSGQTSSPGAGTAPSIFLLGNCF